MNKSIALLILGLAASTSAQNLLVNGGFEAPGLPNPGDGIVLPNGSTAVPGWVSVDNVPSGLAADNGYRRAPYYGHPASEGLHFIYIDNNSFPSPSLNGIHQDFATVPGQAYGVTFDAATEVSYGTPGLLRVSAGSTEIHYTLPNVNAFPLPPSPPYAFAGWSTYSFTFIASAATTRLQFFDEGFQIGGVSSQGNASPLLDNVRVFTTENLVANGSFETPLIPNSAWSLISKSSLAPWQTDGDTFEIWSDGMIANGWGPTYSADGRQNLEVKGGGTAVWQTVTTTIGEDYQLSFHHSPRGGVHTLLTVSINSNSIATLDEDGTQLTTFNWKHFKTNFTATSTATRIYFSDGPPEIVGAGSHIDNVVLASVPGILAGPVTNAANGHIYYLLATGTWETSEAAAARLGGHLATINDQVEQDWVFSTFGSNEEVNRILWIGLRETGTEGNYQWISGEPLSYTHWGAGEPNDNFGACGGENYVQMAYGLGTWNDINSPPSSCYPDNSPVYGVVEVVPIHPVISMQPQGRTTTAGTLTAFTVLAGGTAPLSLQWRKNGVALVDGGHLSGAQTAMLSVSNVFGGDQGGYSVVVSNAFGSVTSAVATLTVIDPLIVSGPFSTEKNLGDKVTFSVAVMGSAPLIYQWRKDGAVVGQGSGASMALTNLQRTDAGSYTVVVSNQYRSATSAVALLTVNLARLDSGFNPGANNKVSSLAMQAEGEILVGGEFAALGGQPRDCIARLNGEGTLDSGFNPEAHYDVSSLAVQADDKILVGGGFATLAGQPRSCLARLNADGTLDSGFNPEANNWVYALAVQPDGKIVVGGSFTSLGGQTREGIARLNADGTLDSGFNPGAGGAPGGRYPAVLSLAVQADGKVLVGGWFTTLGGQPRNGIARLNADGTLDRSFNPGANSLVASLAVQTDGKILVGGSFTTLGGQSRSYLARLNADGMLDSGFNPGVNGSSYSCVWALAVQTDGRILLGGSRITTVAGQARNNLARLNADGTLDRSFNLGADFDVSSLAVQADGKVLVGGGFSTLGGQPRSGIARVNSTEPATQSLSYDGATITWLRDGTSPEVWRTTFECSTDGCTWTNLGVGSRIAGGWQLSGLALLPVGTIRARGFVSGGNYSVVAMKAVTRPSLAITSHTDLQILSTSVIILSGTASDAGSGDSGISSVAVNGVRANNDTASGAGTANWSRPIVLRLGTNRLEVVAGDGRGNKTTNVLRIVSDTAAPKLTIATPKTWQRWSNQVFTATGTAFDNVAVSNVWYQINGAGWVLAQGKSAWSASSMLSQRTNRFEAYAEDVLGNHSLTSRVSFIYVATSPMTLRTNGLGTITRNFIGAFLEVGRGGYTVTAVPSAGQLFTNWSGTILATNNPLKYIMQANMVLQANFVPNPYPELKGSYAGLFMPSSTEAVSGTNAGSATLTLSERGTFSGTLRLAGSALTFTGGFDLARHATVRVARMGKPPLWLNLGIDSQSITGQVSTVEWTANLLALRRATASSNTFAGRYSMLVMGEHGTTNTPPGDSPLGVTVSAPSTVTVSGTMADGSAVTLATGHSAEGTWPFYASLNGGRGLVIGWMSCATNAGSQEVLWVKPPDLAARYCPAGFREERPVAVKRYLPPALKQPATAWSLGRLLIGGGNLSEPLEAEVLVTNNLIRRLSGSASNLSLVITNSNGRFGGSFLHPVTRKTVALRGVLVQGLPWLPPSEQVTVGGGWFLGTNQAGYLWLEPKP